MEPLRFFKEQIAEMKAAGQHWRLDVNQMFMAAECEWGDLGTHPTAWSIADLLCYILGKKN